MGRRYNHERPHEALSDQTPASRYRPSLFPLPAALSPIEYGPADTIKMVRETGVITFHNRTYMIGRAFAHQPIALRPTIQDGLYHVYFCHQKLGVLNLHLPASSKHQLLPLT
jgi:hypothetical protein